MHEFDLIRIESRPQEIISSQSRTVLIANRDGWLTPDEYWGASSWAAFDHNRDGMIDSTEWPW